MLVRPESPALPARPARAARRRPALLLLVALAPLTLAACGATATGQPQTAQAGQVQAGQVQGGQVQGGQVQGGQAPRGQVPPAPLGAANNGVPQPAAAAAGAGACEAAVMASPPDPINDTVPRPPACAQLSDDMLNAIIDRLFPQGAPIKLAGQPQPATPDIAGCQAATARIMPPADPNVSPPPPAECNGVPADVFFMALPRA